MMSDATHLGPPSDMGIIKGMVGLPGDPEDIPRLLAKLTEEIQKIREGFLQLNDRLHKASFLLDTLVDHYGESL